MKRIFYLRFYNPIMRFLNRNKKVLWWSENYDMRVWHNSEPLPVKELMKKSYYQIPKGRL
jgi:hypothetical protein